MIQVGTRHGAPKYQIPGADFVTLENTGMNWIIYNMDPDVFGPTAQPQYAGGPTITDPWMAQGMNMTAGTIS